jgi:hypothetical protein
MQQILKTSEIPAFDHSFFLVQLVQARNGYIVIVRLSNGINILKGQLYYTFTHNRKMAEGMFELVDKVFTEQKIPREPRYWIWTTNPLKFVIDHRN